MSKLRLKPRKGWKYRVIVCLANSKCVSSDVCICDAIPTLAKDLLRELLGISSPYSPKR